MGALAAQDPHLTAQGDRVRAVTAAAAAKVEYAWVGVEQSVYAEVESHRAVDARKAAVIGFRIVNRFVSCTHEPSIVRPGYTN